MFTHYAATDPRSRRSPGRTASGRTGLAVRAFSATVALLVVAAGATACGSSSDTGSSSSDTGPKVVDVTFSGDSVTPNGERLNVAVGQKIELKVTADKAGEIHVHSNPEQELAYDKGTSTVEIKPIEQPGIIEVESHALEKTIFQLEVR